MTRRDVTRVELGVGSGMGGLVAASGMPMSLPVPPVAMRQTPQLPHARPHAHANLSAAASPRWILRRQRTTRSRSGYRRPSPSPSRRRQRQVRIRAAVLPYGISGVRWSYCGAML